jgi:SAM-dependent methyltransferase
MDKKLSQRDYWNGRAEVWNDYDIPLIPSPAEVDFQQKHLVAGGSTLVLGATPELCETALKVSAKVTAVDFAENVIEALRRDGVDYTCMDWFKFFEQSTEKFDNIITDGGLVCLEFPGSWQRIAEQISNHLKPNGMFAARVYVSTLEPPKAHYSNPNLGRFVSSMTAATADSNWMLQPQHPDYAKYDIHYAFPPEKEVLRTFGSVALRLRDRFVPDYEEGARFVSYAWQRS